VGKGLVLGFAVAFIGLAADHLINKMAEGRRRALGL
jgi:glycine betaine/proline transport system permease protein